MNPKYDTKLKVKDMQGEQFQLVQSQDEIDAFNEQYGEDYSYYFIEFYNNDYACALFGSDGIFLHNNAYHVADLF